MLEQQLEAHSNDWEQPCCDSFASVVRAAGLFRAFEAACE